MKKILSIRHPGLAWTRARHISTVKSVTLVHEKNPFAVMINSIINKQEDESYSEYRARSMIDLSQQIPPEMKNKPLLFIKLNQTAIDPIKYEKDKVIEPLRFGHVVTIIGSCNDEGGFSFLKRSLVSKTRKDNFEEQTKFLEERFITGKDRTEPNTSNYPVKEFFIVIDPEQINFNLSDYMERVKQLIDENLPYDMIKDACGHAVYQALTSEKLARAVSAQTATVKALDKMTRHNKQLTTKLEKGIIPLNIDKSGDNVGKDLIRYEQQSTEKPKEFESQFTLK